MKESSETVTALAHVIIWESQVTFCFEIFMNKYSLTGVLFGDTDYVQSPVS